MPLCFVKSQCHPNLDFNRDLEAKLLTPFFDFMMDSLEDSLHSRIREDLGAFGLSIIEDNLLEMCNIQDLVHISCSYWALH